MKKGEKRKQELLKTAYEMFITKGYENTSVDEIIDKAGIAKGTYYYYFASKEQMLEEVIDMMLDAEEEKARMICTKLCQKFTDDEEYLRKELTNAFPRVQCLELTIEHMTGKLVNES